MPNIISLRGTNTMKKNFVIAFLSVALVISIGLNIYLGKSNSDFKHDVAQLHEEANLLENSYEEKLKNANAELSNSKTTIAGLEEVIAERKAEAERIEAERRAKEEAERKAMEEAQRAEAERKAAEAEAARRAAEEEARRNSAGGSHKAEEPTPTTPAPSGGSGQPSSAFGGNGFTDLSGGSDGNGNGSLNIH